MYARTEPFTSDHLTRPDGARVYWEAAGNPDGIPALYLHGGPGSGMGNGGYRRRFDPERYLIVGMDQRGCGRSTPWAIDDLGHLDGNTTQAIIADIEALRTHLGIERWVLHGVSWGSTLALAYALRHPDRVSGVVLVAVTTGARSEIEWLTEGMGAVFPEAWHEFAAAAAPGERVIDAYARLTADPSPSIRAAAADAWDRWESTHISLNPEARPGPLHADARVRQNFAALVTHYWANDCFLPGYQAILPRAAQLEGIPGMLIHGRRDISGPAVTPWRLHRAWPGSRLAIVEPEGHGGPIQMQLAADEMDLLASRL